MLKLLYKPFELLLKHPFTIAKHTRTGTPVIIIELSLGGMTGFGEASMVPYLGESVASASKFLAHVDFTRIKFPFDFDSIITYVDSVAPGNPAIKAAIDIALHDLQGKIEGKPCYSYFHSSPEKMPETSCTIGIDAPDVVREKVNEAKRCSILKIKLGSDNDKLLINTIREVTEKPLYVDANQGWADKYFAVDMAFWLQEKGVKLIEQPMDKTDRDGNAWVTEHSPIPIIADEVIQRLADVEKAKEAYHGINVKLMKSAGMFEAYNIIKRARDLNLKVLIGCMSETSCATLAAAALAPLCDWADLDGPFLTKNNPFKDPEFKQGKYVLSERPGLGLEFL